MEEGILEETPDNLKSDCSKLPPNLISRTQLSKSIVLVKKCGVDGHKKIICRVGGPPPVALVPKWLASPPPSATPKEAPKPSVGPTKSSHRG